MINATFLFYSLWGWMSSSLTMNITSHPLTVGVASSAYQVEGAYLTDGKGQSVWDTFCTIPGKIRNGDTGDIACDHFHHIEEDIQLLHQSNIRDYRFSISWPRVLPTGKRDNINEKGLQFYDRVFDLLECYNITPHVTLYHWDLPQALQDSYGGWSNRQIIHDFMDYADLVLERYSHRVSVWFTLNEPYTVASQAYAGSSFAPGQGEPVFLPYRVVHHMLLAHAMTYHLYHEVYGQGKIGINLNCDWGDPNDPHSDEDRKGVQRYLEFRLAWFSDPLLRGDYPDSMKKRLGNRLPSFTTQEKQWLRGSIDIFALNHYTTNRVGAHYNNQSDFFNDPQVSLSPVPYVVRADSAWLYDCPWGIGHVLLWVRDRYPEYFQKGNSSITTIMPMMITENGVSAYSDVQINIESDPFRIGFLRGYLIHLLDFMTRYDLPVSHYFIWSFLDNFEWASGYSERFGLVHVNFTDPDRKRTPKDSLRWVTRLLSI